LPAARAARTATVTAGLAMTDTWVIKRTRRSEAANGKFISGRPEAGGAGLGRSTFRHPGV